MSGAVTGGLAGCLNGESEDEADPDENDNESAGGGEDRETPDEETPDEETTPGEENGNGEEPEGNETDEGGEADEGNETDQEEQEQEELEEVAYEDGEISGSGPARSEPFELDAGFTGVRYEHDGDGRFNAELLGTDGGDETIANRRREPEGGTAFDVGEGEHVVEVNEADGDWRVVIEQPRPDPADATELPATEAGQGRDYRGPFYFEGEVRVEGAYEGDRNFIAEYLEADGSRGGLLFNVLGSFEEETTVTHDGVAWVTVDVDRGMGRWELAFDHA